MKKIYKILNSKPLLGPRRKFFKYLKEYLASRGEEIIAVPDQFRDLIKEIKKDNELLITNAEAYQLCLLVLLANKLPGDFAEVGTYKGGTSKLIAELKGDKPLYLFDTFTGLPKPVCHDSKHFRSGLYEANLKSVKKYLSGYKEIFIYPGLFPNTALHVRKKSFSFVHLDVDLYKSTLSCLKFFYPRMSKGGIIVSHDYSDSLGVQKAFDEFFTKKPEAIVKLAVGSQCMIMKM